MISKISPDKILTKRGYAVVKEHFDFKTLQKCRKDLNVKPFVNSDYGAEAKPYPIYLESKKKLYLPKFYVCVSSWVSVHAHTCEHMACVLM